MKLSLSFLMLVLFMFPQIGFSEGAEGAGGGDPAFIAIADAARTLAIGKGLAWAESQDSSLSKEKIVKLIAELHQAATIETQLDQQLVTFSRRQGLCFTINSGLLKNNNTSIEELAEQMLSEILQEISN